MSTLYSWRVCVKIGFERMKKLILILLLCFTVNAAASIKVMGDEESLIWFNGAFSWSLQANGSLATDITWVWPADAGSGGQSLLTDGTNILSWGSANLGSSRDIISYAYRFCR